MLPRTSPGCENDDDDDDLGDDDGDDDDDLDDDDDDLVGEGASKGIIYSSRPVGIINVVAFTPRFKSYIL